MTYALITGASSGIGLELAKLFAVDNDLILVSRNQERLEEIASELDCKCICIAKDLSDLSQVKELVDQTRELDIEILVNNAGFGEHGEFAKLDADRQIEMINLNISALTYLCHAFAQRQQGSILNLSSVAAFAPGPMMATYYSTKAYVLNFSFALAEELKPKGIQVSVACPGPTTTNFGKVAKVDKSIPFKVSMSGARVARIIVDEFKQGKTLIITGFRNKFLVALIKVLPRGFSAWVNYLLLQDS